MSNPDLLFQFPSVSSIGNILCIYSILLVDNERGLESKIWSS